MLRAVLVGAAIAAAAIGGTATANAIQAPTAPLPFVTCGGGTYANDNGICVPDPTPATGNTPPSGATARCNDGDWSYSTHHSGTCSGHGGVNQWVSS
jgi:hypothetical protein